MGCCFSSNKVHSEDQHVKSNNEHVHWSYDHTDDWSKHYPNADGAHQSPIDIISSYAIYDENLEKNPIVLNYDQYCFKEIKNNGHTFVVSGNSVNSTVSGGTLQNSYCFAQFHMHWGINDSVGSEHLIDGSSYSAELHFVYWNNQKYSSFKDAAESNKHDGILVLGVLIKAGEENPEFNKLISLIGKIKLSDQLTSLTNELNLRNFLPENIGKYWTYSGSLTTPPCTECVKWIVFSNPIQISSKQLNEFRNLYTCNKEKECSDKTKMSANFRPPCKLNERKIFKSYN